MSAWQSLYTFYTFTCCEQRLTGSAQEQMWYDPDLEKSQQSDHRCCKNKIQKKLYFLSAWQSLCTLFLHFLPAVNIGWLGRHRSRCGMIQILRSLISQTIGAAKIKFKKKMVYFVCMTVPVNFFYTFTCCEQRLTGSAQEQMWYDPDLEKPHQSDHRCCKNKI